MWETSEAALNALKARYGLRQVLDKMPEKVQEEIADDVANAVITAYERDR